jgi:hypothetical protein
MRHKDMSATNALRTVGTANLLETGREAGGASVPHPVRDLRLRLPGPREQGPHRGRPLRPLRSKGRSSSTWRRCGPPSSRRSPPRGSKGWPCATAVLRPGPGHRRLDRRAAAAADPDPQWWRRHGVVDRCRRCGRGHRRGPRARPGRPRVQRRRRRAGELGRLPPGAGSGDRRSTAPEGPPLVVPPHASRPFGPVPDPSPSCSSTRGERCAPPVGADRAVDPRG